MKANRLFNFIVSAVLLAVLTLTIREAIATKAVVQPPVKVAVNQRARQAFAERWVAMGEHYQKVAAHQQRVREADAARWVAIGDYYQQETARQQRIQQAEIDRLNGLAEFYVPARQRALQAETARWNSLVEHYQSSRQRAIQAEAGRWSGQAELYLSMQAQADIPDWEPAASLESVPGSSSDLNTQSLEGCPILSRDGLQLFMASDRPGGLGGLDIWVAEKTSPGEPFGAPVNMGPPINSLANDFCPSPLRDGHGFMFVSNRPGGCGGADIYLTRKHPDGWEEPVNLGCQVNSSADEAGPVLSFAEPGPPTLYFSSNRSGGSGGNDLYTSPKTEDWSFGPAELVPGLNSASDDMQPSVHRDGRELVFASNRPGGLGAFDIWNASRESITSSWSAPFNLGLNVNSPASETRPSLSWEGTTLLFGSNRPGGEGISDIYFSTRD